NMRVLWALGAEHEPSLLGSLGPGDVLLSEASVAELEADRLGREGDRELIDVGVGAIVGPGLLRPVIGDIFDGEAPGAATAESPAERSDAELALALERSEQLVERLRERNEDLEERIGELRYALKARRRKGPLARPASVLRRLRARLRPIYGVRLGLLWHHHPRNLKIPDRYRQESPPSDAPSISIVVPSFNQGGFIDRTLDSVLDQGYPEVELIVQDGGSSDETLTVLDAYSDRLAHVHSGPDGGQAAAINSGFRRSSGEIMAWLNSDDALLPGTLAYVARYFAEHPEVDVVYGHRVLIDTDDREIGRWVMPAHDDEILSWADYVPQETMFWRRGIWEQAGAQMTEEYRFALDWELLVRFRDAGARIVRLPRFLGAFRIHEEQKSSAQVETVGHGEMERLRRRIHGRRVWGRETQRAIRPYLRRHMILDKLWRLGLIRH
ncbi:MAG TPA: glycosyltransferase family 2 protein, partial [Solirubrobacterales bacterium]|nr:glycosyltransferase family 2 protein [Solirubrobacterales bacterium]